MSSVAPEGALKSLKYLTGNLHYKVQIWILKDEDV